MIPNRTILQGDVLEKLKEIPNDSIDCMITSPPYWGLRDYGVEGQWGLEPDFRQYLEKLQAMMHEMKRILKKTGTCWVNLGDSYSGSGKGFGGGPNASKEVFSQNEKPLLNNIQSKTRFGIPERFYTQCIDDGWIARNHIPCYKENSMPSSVKDRFTNKWESVFFFSKHQKYYFNLHAVRIKLKTESKSFNVRVRDAKKGKGQLKLGDDPRAWKMADWEDESYNEKGERIHEKYADEKRKQDFVLGSDGKPKLNYQGFNDRWNEKWKKHYDENGNCLGCGQHWSKHTVSERAKGSMSEVIKRTEPICWCNPQGKNPGDFFFETYTDEEILEWIKLCREDATAWDLCPPDIFFINPHPFPEAHFATFPIALPEKILKCACPPQVCVECGTPRFPILKASGNDQKLLDATRQNRKKGGGNIEGFGSYKNERIDSEYILSEFTKCDCNSKFKPGIVLDPFFGAGTVGVAAEMLGLNWIGIEIKTEYAQIARNRLKPFKNLRLTDVIS